MALEGPWCEVGVEKDSPWIHGNCLRSAPGGLGTSGRDFGGPWTGLPRRVGVVGSRDPKIRLVFFMVPSLSFPWRPCSLRKLRRQKVGLHPVWCQLCEKSSPVSTVSGTPEGPCVYPSQSKMRLIGRVKLPLGTELWQGVGRLGLRLEHSPWAPLERGSGLRRALMGSPP